MLSLSFSLLLSQMKVVAVVLVFFTTALCTVYGRPTGAPSAACENLMPQHGSFTPQDGTSPFILDLSPFECPSNSSTYLYMPGNTYTRTYVTTNVDNLDEHNIVLAIEHNNYVDASFNVNRNVTL